MGLRRFRRFGQSRTLRFSAFARSSKRTKGTAPPKTIVLHNTIRRLICGVPDGKSPIAKNIGHLADSLILILKELPPPYGDNNKLSPLYTPFLARSLLELCCTIICARMDSFRILTIAQIQSHASYDPGVPVALAFRWQGDVLADKNDKGEKNELWSSKLKPEQTSRAILSDYQDQVFWRPAFKRFLDAANRLNKPRDWTSQLLKINLDGFVHFSRSLMSGVFSKSSKGIHHEFVVPIASYYDNAFLKDLIDDSVRAVSSLAVVAGFCDHLIYNVPEDQILSLFEEIQL